MSRIAETKNGTIVYRDMTAEEEQELSPPMTKGSQPMTEEERLADLESRIAELESIVQSAGLESIEKAVKK